MTETKTRQDAIDADAKAGDALMAKFADLFAALKAFGAGQSGQVEADDMEAVRVALSKAEGELETALQSVNDLRIRLCEGPWCERLDWRLRAELNSAQYADGHGWCEECIDRENALQRQHERMESHR